MPRHRQRKTRRHSIWKLLRRWTRNRPDRQRRTRRLWNCCIRLLRSEEHTSELQSQSNLVCRLLLEKKKKQWTRGCLNNAPKPRRYAQKHPKKTVRLSLASAHTNRANDRNFDVIYLVFAFADVNTLL